jgi:tellurite resistance protein
MGGFDRNQAERVVELMVLAAWADGRVEGSEAIAIQRLVSTCPLLEHLGPTAAIGDATRARLRSKGMEECLREACAALTDNEYRELAFQCCARVMGADRAFPAEEENVLHRVVALLGLDVHAAERLLVLATRAH